MVVESELRRIYWASRRGMLELDLMLVPFVENQFRQLTSEDQACYVKLLESEDNDLFAWCLGSAVPEDPELASIVGKIRDYAKQPG